MKTTTRLLLVELVVLIGFFLSGTPASGQIASLLQVEVTDQTVYVFDGAPLSQLATLSAKQPALKQKTFAPMIGIGDIASVNGVSMKGAAFENILSVLSSPTFKAGWAISDAQRTGLYEWNFDFQLPDGTELGTVRISGMGGGPPPPGAPAGIDHAAYMVIGGTGAFADVRGYYAATPDPASPARVTSAIEDPAYRRVNGGGLLHASLYLSPATPPQVVSASAGPLIYHSDLQLVSIARPAMPGETLFAMATGLGPVRPSVPPGGVFPSDPPASVMAPVAVTVNGAAATVSEAIGWPGSAEYYRITFRVPDGTAMGTGAVRLSVAWMWGPDTYIPVGRPCNANAQDACDAGMPTGSN